MLEKLREHLDLNFKFLAKSRLLLAVSGGIDSMVMADLFDKLGYAITLAHCDFQLRGEESFEDEKFVRNYAAKHGIPLHVTHFDTRAFAEDYKLSIQLAARELRYNWFAELLQEHGFDYVLTAHHADDNLETFIINLSRGTGIDGLCGIPQQNENIVRPLLCFSRSEIEAYANQNGIVWREDSSNASDTYLRNQIRQQLTPQLKKLNPDFEHALQKTQVYLQQSRIMAEDAAIMVYQQVAQQAGDEIHFNLKKLMQLPNYRSYLYHWLREYGFSDWDALYELATAQSGKQLYAPGFRLIKNRHFFILAPQKEIDLQSEFEIPEGATEVNFPLKLSIAKVPCILQTSNSTIFVDAQKLHFPLVLRKWNQGDAFEPAGMNGNSKKVGKFFKDEKLSVIDKENMWLLCSQNQIVWIVGLRQDGRFKAGTDTKEILQITLFP